MNMETQCQCIDLPKSNPVSSVGYTYTSIKTTVKYQQVQHEAIRENAQVTKNKGKLNLSEVMNTLADIRVLLKPWFFPGASKHNGEVAHNYARQIVNHPQFNREVSFEVIVKKLQYDNHLSTGVSQVIESGKSGCCTSASQPLLTDQDKHMLEEVHQAMAEQNLDTSKLSSLAGNMIFDRMGSVEKPHLLSDRHYLESSLAKLGLAEKFDIGNLQQRLLDRVKRVNSELHHV